MTMIEYIEDFGILAGVSTFGDHEPSAVLPNGTRSPCHADVDQDALSCTATSLNLLW